MLHRLDILSLVIGCAALLSFANSSWTDSYVGYAYENGNSKPVYTEQFTDKYENGKHIETTTDYFDAAGKHIASRTIDFSRSRFAPDFRTEDLRTGYVEGSEMMGKRFRLFVRKNKNSALQEKFVDVPQPVVIDGGFNQFIKAHWSDIQNGKTVCFYFTVSSKLDFFKLRVAKAGETSSSMKVRIEPDQALLRWIASPILVNYDVNTKRITSYEGKSNIAGDDGSNLIIKLIYPEKGP